MMGKGQDIFTLTLPLQRGRVILLMFVFIGITKTNKK
jgi:hypothetical protein